MKLLHLLPLLLLTFGIQAQDKLILLKKITGNYPFTGSGLGQSFHGDVLNDGNLYVQGNADGLVNSYWKSDGTTNGTVQIAEEPGYGRWDRSIFLPEGILTDNEDGTERLVFYDISSSQNVELGSFENRYIRQYAAANGDYYLMVRMEDQIELWKTDLTPAGTMSLGDFGEDQTFLHLTASEYGAVVFNTNTFTEDVPMYYKANTNETHILADYLATFKSITEVNHAYLVDQYMYLQVVEDGFQKNYTFNVSTEQFYPFQYIREIVETYDSGDNKYLFTSTDIVKFSTIDYSNEEIFGDVFPFSTFLRDGQYVYFIGSETFGEELIYRLDMATDDIYLLPNAKTGSSFYNSRFAKYNDEFYFISSDGTSQYLNKYDFANETTVFVDTSAVKNGAVTVAAGMKVVNGKLIVSKFRSNAGHELHYLGTPGSSSTQSIEIEQERILANPTLTKNNFRLTSDIDFIGLQMQLYNQIGKLALTKKMTNHQVNIQHLPAGQYWGIIRDGNTQYTFRVIRE